MPLLLEAGHEVTAVGRTAEKRHRLEGIGANPIELNLYNPAQVRRAVVGHDCIVNLSTAVPPGLRSLWPPAWREMDRVRREISANFAAAALQEEIPRIIQESFAPIYPDSGNAWVDESTIPAPASYNRACLDAESNAGRLTLSGGAAVILRFAYFYGPGDMNTTTLIKSVARGWYPLFGKPEGYSSWVHHDDAATAVIAALDVPAGIYNVVEDLPMRRIDLAQGLARELKAVAPKFLPRWSTFLAGSVGQTLARSLRISNRTFKQVAPWAPHYPRMLDGLVAILASDQSLTSGT